MVESTLRLADLGGGGRERARGRDLIARETRPELVLHPLDAAVNMGCPRKRKKVHCYRLPGPSMLPCNQGIDR